MRHLDSSAVTATVGMPVKGKTFPFLVDGVAQVIEAAVRAIIGGVTTYDNTKAYILFGCEATGTDPGARVITAGAVFYNGEVYLVDDASFTTTGSEVAVGTITDFSFADAGADPVMFTDFVARNIHLDKKIVFAAGLSGSGDVNFNEAIDLKRRPIASIGQQIFWKLPGGVYADYFDNTGLGIHALTKGFADCNGNNGTIDWRGFAPVGYKPGDANFGTIGGTGGNLNHTVTQNNIQQFQISSPGSGSTSGVGFPVNGGDQTDGTVTFNVGVTSPTPISNLQPYKVALMIQRIS